MWFYGANLAGLLVYKALGLALLVVYKAVRFSLVENWIRYASFAAFLADARKYGAFAYYAGEAVKWASFPVYVAWAVRGFVRATKFGASSVLGADGEVQRWSYNDSGFSVVADFVAQTVSISAGRGLFWDRRSGEKENVLKDIHATFPMREFEFESKEATRTKSYTTYATGVGTGTAFVGDQAVTVTAPVSVPTGVATYQETSGKDCLFYCSKSEWKVGRSGTTDGTADFAPRVFRTYNPKNACVWLTLTDKKADAFLKAWEPILKRIAAIEMRTGEALLADAKSKDGAARAAIQAFVAGSGLPGDARWFANWVGETPKSIVAMSREGALVVQVDRDVWSGPAAGAIAKMVEDKSGSFLEIEVRDEAFERESLAKRRFKVLPGGSKETLRNCMDAVNILGNREAG